MMIMVMTIVMMMMTITAKLVVIKMSTNLTQCWSHLSERMPDPIAPTMIPNMYTLWG